MKVNFRTAFFGHLFNNNPVLLQTSFCCQIIEMHMYLKENADLTPLIWPKSQLFTSALFVNFRARSFGNILE